MDINWDSGDGLPLDPEIDDAIEQIAREANKGNDGDEFEIAENVARDALRTALYNPQLLRSVLERLERMTSEQTGEER